MSAPEIVDTDEDGIFDPPPLPGNLTIPNAHLASPNLNLNWTDPFSDSYTPAQQKYNGSPAKPTPSPLDFKLSSTPKTSNSHQTSKQSSNKTITPPKTAFMCFSAARTGNRDGKLIDLDTLALEYRNLDHEEKEQWEEIAKKDKQRYLKEKNKSSFVPPNRRGKKHPLAPKRPMSAFLRYSKCKRKEVKQENPHVDNTDISRILGHMWRNATEEEKEPFVQQELKDRAVYKREMKKWRAQQEHISNASSSPIKDNSVQEVEYKTHSHRHSTYPHNNSAPYNQDPMNRYSHDPYHGLHYANSWEHSYYPSHGEHFPHDIGPYNQWNQRYDFPNDTMNDYHQFPQEYQDNEPVSAHKNHDQPYNHTYPREATHLRNDSRPYNEHWAPIIHRK